MVLQLDPRYPLVWRTPNSLQLGVDAPPVVMTDVSVIEERLISALVAGVTRPGLTMLANSAGGDELTVTRLLRALHPALRAESTPPPPRRVTIAGTGPTAERLADALASSGMQPVFDPQSLRHPARAVQPAPRTREVQRLEARVAGPQPDEDLAVIVAHFVIEPELHGRWLRRDIPHLAIVFGDTGATVGPIVEPGTGPCLYCLERRRTDVDPAWPAIASQLWGRRSAIDTGLLATEVAAMGARVVIDRVRRGAPASAATSVRVSASSGARRRETWLPHPECGCGALPGSGTAAVAQTGGAPPRRRTGGA